MPKSDTQWKKGQSGNPSGRPKAIVSVVELARAQTEKSIETLVAIRDNAEAPAAARVGRSQCAARPWMGQTVSDHNSEHQ